MAGFKDILPIILGAGAGLVSPQVGPALARGVGMWQASRDRDERRADRRELMGYRERSEARAEKNEERADVRFGQSQEDREYELSQRPEDEKWKKISRGLTLEGAERARRGEGRAIDTFEYGKSQRETMEQRAAAAAQRQAENHAYLTAERERQQRQRVAWGDLAQTIIDDPNNAEFMNYPALSAYVQSGDGEGIVKLYGEYTKAQTSSAEDAQKEVNQLNKDRIALIRRKGEIDAKRAQMLDKAQGTGNADQTEDFDISATGDPYEEELAEIARQLTSVTARLSFYGIEPVRENSPIPIPGVGDFGTGAGQDVGTGTGSYVYSEDGGEKTNVEGGSYRRDDPAESESKGRKLAEKY